MKIFFGPYTNRLTCRIYERHMNKKYDLEWDDSVDTIDRIINIIDKYTQKVYNIFNFVWFDKQTNQKKYIRIDNYDTWGMDYTLAQIIAPMLVQLKKVKEGAPNVDDLDVPEELRMSKEDMTRFAKDGSSDDNFFKRWDWVLDEMIWAFEQKQRDDWESDYVTGEYDLQVVDNKIIKGPDHTLIIDWDNQKAHQERMTNGFRLFGKYFESLWT